MTISVIIPTLNEEKWILPTLCSVQQQPGAKEVIVADGGSSDTTVKKAGAHAKVLRAVKGRAHQMNAGAAAASGEVLFFIHADTMLPPKAFATIRRLLSRSHLEAGAFRLRFNRQTPLLRFYSFCTRLPLPSLCFGDRGLFVRRSVFNEVGGFPEVPIFEDLEMVRRLHRRGGFSFAAPYVTTAARRFTSKGPLRQQMRNTLLWSYYMLGGAPEKVTRFYRYNKNV